MCAILISWLEFERSRALVIILLLFRLDDSFRWDLASIDCRLRCPFVFPLDILFLNHFDSIDSLSLSVFIFISCDFSFFFSLFCTCPFFPCCPGQLLLACFCCFCDDVAFRLLSDEDSKLFWLAIFSRTEPSYSLLLCSIFM